MRFRLFGFLGFGAEATGCASESINMAVHDRDVL